MSLEPDNSPEPDRSPQRDKSPQLDSSDTKPLKMLCRRGLKELDLILKFYLEKHAHSASIDEINAFKSLLKMDDHSLLSLILNPEKAQSSALVSLCKKLQQSKH
jgi:antitoxin CptB